MTTTTETLQAVQAASRELINIPESTINAVLNELAGEILTESDHILAENQKDCDAMSKDNPKFDRLLLTKERLTAIANDLKNIARLPIPYNQILEERTLKSGLQLQKITTPIGVIGIVYEARPNVTVDVFSLCFKSGNACVLKGGADAWHSNQAFVSLIKKVLTAHQLNPNLIHLTGPQRSEVSVMFNAHGLIDLIIPRGSQRLIDFVRENSKIPVIETGAGIVHIYLDEKADIDIATRIIENSKIRRPSVCNALDCLLIHEKQLDNLAKIVTPLAQHQVEIFADAAAYEKLTTTYPKELLHQATKADFGREFLSLKMAIKTVASLEEALTHIARYSSKHSEAIISADENNIAKFLKNVDAAAVYANAATTFTDGAQFGLGAEIGISTQKLHARGPMALKELVSYKYTLTGHGEIRP